LELLPVTLIHWEIRMMQLSIRRIEGCISFKQTKPVRFRLEASSFSRRLTPIAQTDSIYVTAGAMAALPHPICVTSLFTVRRLNLTSD
jgi:hypothetical protein